MYRILGNRASEPSRAGPATGERAGSAGKWQVVAPSGRSLMGLLSPPNLASRIGRSVDITVPRRARKCSSSVPSTPRES